MAAPATPAGSPSASPGGASPAGAPLEGASPAGVPDPAARPRGLDRRGMTVIGSGHALADCCQGAVPALLPFLIATHGWSYALASALVLAQTVSSSIIQPLFGIWADRRPLARLLPGGVLLAGVGVGFAAVAPSYALCFAAIVASGLGVAAFHPEGSRFAAYLSGERRATGMSLFSVGGNVGFALGPLLVTPLVAGLGLPGGLLLMLPAAAVAGWIAVELPRLESFRPARPARPGAGLRPNSTAAQVDWSAFARLNLVITARTAVFFGLLTFIPLYYVDVLRASTAAGNLALAVFLVGGALGTLVGGALADRVGRRPVVLGSLAVLPPLVVGFHAASQGVATALLLVLGAATIATFSVTTVMGQEYLPNRIGLASGTTLGLSIGLGGLFAPLLGLLADARGLDAVLDAVAVLPILGVLSALTLPRESRR